MTRTLAFLTAMLLTAVTVTASCLASPAEGIAFSLEPARTAGEVRLSLRSGTNRDRSNMSTDFRTSELAGLDTSRLYTGGPLSFALVREAGRVDCAGTGRGTRA